MVLVLRQKAKNPFRSGCAKSLKIASEKRGNSVFRLTYPLGVHCLRPIVAIVAWSWGLVARLAHF